jgi:ribonuclease HI
MDPEQTIQIPAYRLHAPTVGRQTERREITIYTDGSCINNGKLNVKCGSGIWISKNHPLNHAISIPGPKQSNQISEIVAILVALQSMSPMKPVKIITDSKYIIRGLTTHLKDWEDNSWIGVSNDQLFKATVYHSRRHSDTTTFQWVKGHDGDIGNEQADSLTNDGALKEDTDIIDTCVPRNFDLQGTKLTTITQKLAYQAITKKTHLEYNRTMLGLLDITRFAVKVLSKNEETDNTIWHSCRSKDLSKNFQMFIYKTQQCIQNWRLLVPEHRVRCPV